MTGRALVIKTSGTPEIAEAIAEGIRANQPTAEEFAAMKAELEAAKLREAALAVRTVRDKDYFYCKVREAEYYYGDNPHHCKAAQFAMGLIGLICELVDGCYKYLSSWNREA